jgi:hypothetical protein
VPRATHPQGARGGVGGAHSEREMAQAPPPNPPHFFIQSHNPMINNKIFVRWWNAPLVWVGEVGGGYLGLYSYVVLPLIAEVAQHDGHAQ